MLIIVEKKNVDIDIYIGPLYECISTFHKIFEKYLFYYQLIGRMIFMINYQL